MIKSIFNGTTIEPLVKVMEKLNWYRKLSQDGLHNLSKVEIDDLLTDCSNFFNVETTLNSEILEVPLYRITNNRTVINESSYRLIRKISDLYGPPKDKININRCNFPKEPLFYASIDLRTALWELQPENDGYITISEWKIKPGHKFIAHAIFNPDFPVNDNHANEAREKYFEFKQNTEPELALIYEEILKFFCEEFYKDVPRENGHEYLFSAFCSSKLMTNAPHERNKIDAIIYPSTKMELGMSNIALQRGVAHQKLDLIKITVIDVARSNFNPNNRYTPDIILPGFHIEVSNFDFENDQILYDDNEFLDKLIEQDSAGGFRINLPLHKK